MFGSYYKLLNPGKSMQDLSEVAGISSLKRAVSMYYYCIRTAIFHAANVSLKEGRKNYHEMSTIFQTEINISLGKSFFYFCPRSITSSKGEHFAHDGQGVH
jgi:hypothetical protein